MCIHIHMYTMMKCEFASRQKTLYVFLIEVDTSRIYQLRAARIATSFIGFVSFARSIFMNRPTVDRACRSKRRLLMTLNDPTSSRENLDNFLAIRSWPFAFTRAYVQRARDKNIARQSNNKHKLFLDRNA